MAISTTVHINNKWNYSKANRLQVRTARKDGRAISSVRQNRRNLPIEAIVPGSNPGSPTVITLKQYNDMKAIRVSVSFHEWSKVEGFLGLFMEDEDTFIYLVDNVTFIAVFAGECAMAYFKAALAEAFDEETIIVKLR